MSTQIVIPQMGESITEGVVAKWLKSVGESVEADEPVVEVETDKITVEVPAPRAGVLREQKVGEGDTVAVGDVIGEIDESAAAASAPPPATAAEPKPQKGNGRDDSPIAMPAARAEADRTGVDLGSVEGTGRGGRILKEDVQRAEAPPKPAARPEPAPAPKPVAARPARDPGTLEERKAMTPLRRRVAERLVHAQQTAAILTTFNEADMSAVMELRKKYKEPFKERHGVKLGFMSFFIKAAVDSLKAFPSVNAEIDGTDVIYKYHYDIGVAVGGGKGLVVPVIRGADTLSFADIEKTILDYAKKAKTNKLKLDDLTGGTFTISNGGVYGSMLSTPILNPPQTGILGLHNIQQRPMAIAGNVEVRPMMYLALTYDHRLVDGREAVQFLVHLKECIEAPERMFLEV